MKQTYIIHTRSYKNNIKLCYMMWYIYLWWPGICIGRAGHGLWRHEGKLRMLTWSGSLLTGSAPRPFCMWCWLEKSWCLNHQSGIMELLWLLTLLIEWAVITCSEVYICKWPYFPKKKVLFSLENSVEKLGGFVVKNV